MSRGGVVLAYHGLGVVPRELDPHNLMLDPEVFRRQMLALKRRGCRFETVDGYVTRVERQESSSRSCVLTFDDGSSDALSVLAPILDELGLCATIYVCPGLLGQPHPYIEPEAGVRLLREQELVELARRPNIEIGGHTRLHVDLSNASLEEALEEMSATRIDLERLIDRPVTTFAYPFCTYSAACPAAAEQAGYRAAVTCGGRGGSALYELSRESVGPLDGRVSFALKSRGWFLPIRRARVGALASGVRRIARRTPLARHTR